VKCIAYNVYYPYYMFDYTDYILYSFAVSMGVFQCDDEVNIRSLIQRKMAITMRAFVRRQGKKMSELECFDALRNELCQIIVAVQKAELAKPKGTCGLDRWRKEYLELLDPLNPKTLVDGRS
jgi:hypothetical protein